MQGFDQVLTKNMVLNRKNVVLDNTRSKPCIKPHISKSVYYVLDTWE